LSRKVAAIAAGVFFCAASPALAATASGPEPIYLFGIPVDFILFALTLLGVALLHNHTLAVALTGLAAITLYKVVFTGFKFGVGISGLGLHMQHEWVILANLFLLLMGFALLSRHFEKSRIPDEMPAWLPDDWKGAFVLLVIVGVISSFLDNIAAALIGGTMARHVFRGKVHIGYLAAIVAASNAGGSGSVVGDTTTTMMWIDGVSPLSVLEAFVAASVAMVIFGIPAALQQHKYSPILKEAPSGLSIEWARVADGSTLQSGGTVGAASSNASQTARPIAGSRSSQPPWLNWPMTLATIAAARTATTTTSRPRSARTPAGASFVIGWCACCCRAATTPRKSSAGIAAT